MEEVEQCQLIDPAAHKTAALFTYMTLKLKSLSPSYVIGTLPCLVQEYCQLLLMKMETARLNLYL